jgi:hypothetical protein
MSPLIPQYALSSTLHPALGVYRCRSLDSRYVLLSFRGTQRAPHRRAGIFYPHYRRGDLLCRMSGLDNSSQVHLGHPVTSYICSHLISVILFMDVIATVILNFLHIAGKSPSNMIFCSKGLYVNVFCCYRQVSFAFDGARSALSFSVGSGAFWHVWTKRLYSASLIS